MTELVKLELNSDGMRESLGDPRVGDLRDFTLSVTLLMGYDAQPGHASNAQFPTTEISHSSHLSASLRYPMRQRRRSRGMCRRAEADR
jgi:hypothetical protein